MRKKRILFSLCMYLFIMMMLPVKIGAASYIKISMNGKAIRYEGTQVKVLYRDKKINLSKTPGIVVNNIALLPYTDVFQKGLGASCSYNSKNGHIEIKQYGVKVRLTVGSTVAYIDGKKTPVSVSPRKVYYHNSKSTKILVPSRFVAEALGYSYHWNSKTSSVELKDPYALFFNEQWHVYHGTKGNVTIDGVSVNVKDMPSIVVNNSVFVQAKKVFGNKLLNSAYTHNTKSKTVTITIDDNKIKFILDSTTAYVNGKKHVLKASPKLVKDNVSKKSYVLVPAKFTSDALGLAYKWNSNTKTSEITVKKRKIWSWKGNKVNSKSLCKNTLESIIYEWTKEEQYILFNGKTPLSMERKQLKKQNAISITISDLNNVSTMLEKENIKSDNVSNIEISECETGSLTVTVYFTKNTTYYESVSGSQYEIHFCQKETKTDENTMLFTLPKGVSFSELEDEDCYYNHQFKIIMKGNYVSYYKYLTNTLPKGVRSVKCSLDSKKHTVLTFYTTKVLGYKLSEHGDSFGVKVGNPKDIYKNIVLLDAGHGGSDPGAIDNGVNEKDVNFNILYRFCKTYFDRKDSPVKAYWTRTTDTKIDLYERAAYAKEVGADIFISLHMNSAGTSAANGTETYYCLENNGKNEYGLTSKTLASYFQYNWSPKLGLSTSRGVKTANFVVIKKNTVPAILIELGFLSGKKDFSIISSLSNQKKASKYFYQTVCNFFEEYPTGR